MHTHVISYIEQLTSIFRDIDLYVNYTGPDEDKKELRAEIAQAIRNYHIEDEIGDMVAIKNSVIHSILTKTTDVERKLYCLSLLQPFEEYAQQMPRYKPVRHIRESPFVEGVGVELMPYVELYHGRKKDQALTDDEVIGMETLYLLIEVATYADMLDAAFAVCGIDLKTLQERCGIILKEYVACEDELTMRARKIAQHVGGFLSAMDYLQQLPRYAQSSTASDVVQEQPQSSAKELRDLLPQKLQTNEIITIFERAIEAGMIEHSTLGLEWKETKQLAAYLAERMSNRFALSTRLDKDGNTTISWKTFESIFAISGLKDAKQNWMRVNIEFTPTGYEKVDELLCVDNEE